tara:strand:+ start:3364 stop:3564 length:201 start_codon:yes stop_codon:yes gene_type:complete
MLNLDNEELTCQLCNGEFNLDSLTLPNSKGTEIIMVHGKCIEKAGLIPTLEAVSDKSILKKLQQLL